jgi:hypothetical protein
MGFVDYALVQVDKVLGILGSPVLNLVYWYATPLTPVVHAFNACLLLLATIVSLC